MSREEINRKQREYRLKNNNKCTIKYEKTFNGKIMRMYRNVKSRCLGINKKKSHLYEGLPFISKEEFYSFLKSSKEFKLMYQRWVDSGYERKLCPTVDRIKSDEGYVLGNMQILTHSENSAKGSRSRYENISNS